MIKELNYTWIIPQAKFIIESFIIYVNLAKRITRMCTTRHSKAEARHRKSDALRQLELREPSRERQPAVRTDQSCERVQFSVVNLVSDDQQQRPSAASFSIYRH